VIKMADYIIDLGPEGGDGGGEVIATGSPEELVRHKSSYTAQYLKAKLESERKRQKAAELRDAAAEDVTADNA
jgi:excinuclease ABC subunit A